MLTAQITDLDNKVLTTLTNALEITVDIPLNDSRTASARISVFDPACVHIKPLRHMLKIQYHDWLVFWGVILAPEWTSEEVEASTVTIHAHDPTIWWKRNYHRYGDPAVELGYTIDGDGIKRLHESALPTTDQLSRGVRSPGILYGEDTSVKDPAILSEAARGQNVYDSITNISSSVIGPDWDLRPMDPAHPGIVNAGTVAGYQAELNIFAKRQVDRSKTVVFHKGFGRSNLQSFQWTQDGDAARNYAVVVAPGGERDSFDVNRRAMSHNEQAWLDFGIYQQWESSHAEDTKALLQQKANAIVAHYAEPPDKISMTLNPEGAASGTAEAPYRYIYDFTVGDLVRGVCKTGFMHADVVVRVMRVTLSMTGGVITTSLETITDIQKTAAGDPGN